MAKMKIPESGPTAKELEAQVISRERAMQEYRKLLAESDCQALYNKLIEKEELIESLKTVLAIYMGEAEPRKNIGMESELSVTAMRDVSLAVISLAQDSMRARAAQNG